MNESRRILLDRAARLSMVSVGFSGCMAAAAMLLALRTGSLSLGGFGLASFIDAAASLVLVWRFRIERRQPHRGDHVESRAALAVGISLMFAGTYVATQAARSLADGASLRFSPVAMILAALSLVALPPLAMAKRAVARALPSGALRHDGFLTLMGAVMAGLALAGLALAGAFSVGWPDELAALVIALILAVDGWEAILTR